MSSMLKKPGAGAFKPKAPIARRRPAPNLAAQSPAHSQAVDAQSSASPAQDSTPGPSQDVVTPPTTAESRLEQTVEAAATDVVSTGTSTSTEREQGITTRAAASKSPEARRVAPAAKASRAAQPPAEPQTSGAPPQAEQSTESAEQAPGVASATSVSDAPPATISKATPRGKSTTSTGRTKSAWKPQSAAETTAPEAPPPAILSLSTPSADGEGPETSTSIAPAKTKKPAPRQPRKRKAADTTGEGEAETATDAADATKKKRAPRKKKAVTNGADGEFQQEGAENGESATSKRKPIRKRKTAEHGDENGPEPDVEDTEAEDAEPGKAKKKRRKRSVTPEDAEHLQIDPMTMTVGELTRDIKTGKRWKDGQKIREADLEKKRDALKQRLINQGKLQEGEDLPKESSEAGTPVPNGSTPAPAQAPPSPVQDLPTGISIRVLNGQIVANEESAQYDRHAEAARNRGELEVREENEFSNRVNQQSHMKRLPPKSNWTHEETAKFYHGLRMFGTDFNMISKMFGGDRTRRQIKLKFNREERANPVGVNKCIIGEKDTAMDLDAVGGAEGLEDSKVIEDELARLREEREAETKRLEEELAAEAKRKRDELLGKRKGDPISGKDKGGKGQQSGHGGDGDMGGAPNGSSSAAAAKDKAKHKEEPNPGAKYGVGIDPDVIDETDLPTNSSYGRGTGRGRGGRGGRRGGKVSSVFASGFGV